MWKLLELTACDLPAVPAQMRELGEGWDLVELGRAASTVMLQPPSHVKHHLFKLHLFVSHIRTGDHTNAV